MTYRIELNHVAQKQFRRLERQAQRQLKPHIQSLQCGLNPRCKKLASYDNRYRLRVAKCCWLSPIARMFIAAFFRKHSKIIY